MILVPQLTVGWEYALPLQTNLSVSVTKAMFLLRNYRLVFV